MKRYEVNRNIPGLPGLFRLPTGAKSAAEHALRLALVEKLVRAGQLDTLLALQEKALSWNDLLEADREGALHHALDRLQLRRPLWAAVESRWPEPGTSTTRRYRVSFRKLATMGLRELGPRARVSDLARVDWAALCRRWPGSPSDWNHVRRAVSRLFTELLYKGHPVWARLRSQFPILAEVEREPDVEVEQLAAFLAAQPDWCRDLTVTLVVTGLRTGELFRPPTLGSYVVRVTAGKGRLRKRLVHVDPTAWPFVRRAVADIQAGRSYEAYRYAFDQARAAVGLDDLTRHDLRHVAGQLLEAAGMRLTEIQQILGHTDVKMSARYARRRVTKRGAGLLAEAAAPLLTDTSGVIPLRRKA